MTTTMVPVMLLMLVVATMVSADEAQCGWQAGGKLCPNCFCCSHDGFCGNTTAWCTDGCQI